jgi:copper chaperone CopZ
MERNPRRKRGSNSRDQWIICGGALLLVLALGGMTWAAGRTPAKPDVLESVAIRVEGMDCHVWCPIQIDDALADMPGVFDLFVDVDSGTVTAQVDPQKTTRDALVQKLRGRGWNIMEPSESAPWVEQLER